MSGELALIDSNILTYVFDADEPDKQRVCRELISDCWNRKRKYAVSVQNLSEFYVVVTSKIKTPIPKKIASEFVSSIVKFHLTFRTYLVIPYHFY